jgi:protein MpaA
MPTPTVRDVRKLAAVLVGALLTACSSGSAASPSIPATSTSTVIIPVVTEPVVSTSTPATTSTTLAATTTSTTPATTSTSTSTTSTSTVAPIPTIPPLPQIAAIDARSFPVDTEIEIGRSVEGRPITVIRRGDPDGARVIAVGAIHGNEDAGVAIIDRLAVEPVPEGVELWLVRSINPDGQARQDRQNANAVDLNRNFPHKWDVLGTEGDWQYGGTGPASEPETQTMVALGDAVRPDLILWYHQDLFRISPSTGRDGEARARYAAIAGLPLIEVTGGTYTGTASQWSRTVATEVGIGFTVELGPTLSESDVTNHVAAVLAVASEFF